MEELPAEPQGFVMTFVKQNTIIGTGVRQVGQIRLPFVPRQGDFFVLPNGDNGTVQQVRFDLSAEGGFGILVILGGQQRGQG